MKARSEVGAVVAVVVVAVAVVVGAAAAGSFAGSHGQERPAASTGDPGARMQHALDEGSVATSEPFPTDAHGWTYGAIPDQGRAPYAAWPDLIAVGLDGTSVGFVRKPDLHFSADPADNPSTPALMLAYASRLPRTLTVYAPDGTTVLGSMPSGH